MDLIISGALVMLANVRPFNACSTLMAHLVAVSY